MKRWITPLALLALVFAAAEVLKMRTSIYVGAAGGFVVGLVGFVAAVRILARHKHAGEKNERSADIWALWGGGLLVRLALLGLLTWLFWRHPGIQLPEALLSLGVVYLVLHFWETQWLFVQLIGNNRNRSETDHG